MLDQIIIDDEKEVTLFVNTIDKINQVMKKIDNNTTGYYVDKFIAESFDINQFPRRVVSTFDMYSLNKKQQAIFEKYIDYLTYKVNVPDDLFQFIKNYKKEIKKVIINEDEMIFKTSFIEFPMQRITHEFDKIDKLKLEDVICNFKVIDETLLSQIYGYKGVFKLFIDIDNETISINEIPQSESYLKVIISHKYLTGFQNCKADGKSHVEFEVVKTDIKDVYLIKIIPTNKNFRTENQFCVVDC